MKHVHIKQALEENMEAAATLLRCTYNFYRESSCGTLPSGINMYTVPSHLTTEGPCQPFKDNVDYLDLSTPRKLLLWAYTLVHGCYSNILAVVKHCEENAKFARVEEPRVNRDVHRINNRQFPCQTAGNRIL
ncbi:calcineurin-binding protein 1-like [Magnolia sinica]|uniref:calcineurin-binding protein 1-like n=1 Tax=Magnolia sinica TaxID=86752 RepID=UPI00265A29FC|nr:calcineurin-binding protein 1-like [Magnolia sinica]